MAKKDPHIGDELLARYLAGECSIEEEQIVESWLDRDVHAQKIFSQSKNLFEAKVNIQEQQAPNFDTNAAWQKVYKKLDIPQTGLKPEGKSKNLFINYVWKVAAVLVIGIGISWFFINRERPIYYSANSGKVKEFYLPDSSLIVLKDGSKLIAKKGYGSENRDVELNGIAYFDVQENASLPFVIQMEDAQIQVLGTQFLVDGQSPALIKVTVESGKVRLSSVRNADEVSIVLTKNQSAELNIHDQTITESSSANLNNLYWANKKLTYRQRPLSEVFDELETLFQRDIVYDSATIRNCQMTAVFRQETFDTILKNMSTSLGFTFEKRDEQYIIQSDGCTKE